MLPIRLTMRCLVVSLLLLAGLGFNGPVHAALAPIVAESGRVSASIDGLGTSAASGMIQVQKPAGATVRSAFLAAATVWGLHYAITNTDITLDGAFVTFTTSVINPTTINNYFADVTALVKTKIDAAPAGLVDIVVGENNSQSIDGTILTVIFDDPNVSADNTVVLFFGVQNPLGDSFNISLGAPVNLADPNLAIDLSLGISFGYQTESPANDQYSQIDVNSQRLTTSAGGQDDGPGPTNGALLTVGGIGDSNANPADPNALPDSVRYDDELYTLLPFVTNGATSIQVATLNPSNNDNIFFGALMVQANVAIVGEGILLSPQTATGLTGTPHTVTAKLQDDNGLPLAERSVDFSILSGPNAELTGNGVTDVNGEATFTYTSSTAGTDVIVASFVDSQSLTRDSNRVTQIWEQPSDQIALSPLTATGLTGVAHTVTAKVQDGNGLPLAERSVNFSILSGPNAGLTGNGVTDVNGEATFTYTSSAAGTDVIVASFVDGQSLTRDSNQVTKVWELPDQIDLSPLTATRTLYLDLLVALHTVTAKVQDGNGLPLAERSVNFSVLSGPSAGLTGNGVTDVNGEASFVYSSTTAGTDVIVASFVDNQGLTRDSNQVTMVWELPNDQIALSPLTATGLTGVAHTVTALVQDGNGLPLADRTVHFSVLSGPNAELTGNGVTDVNGEATFTYTSATTGRDVIVASFVDSQSLTRDSNQVTKVWEQPVYQINLTPRTATGPTGAGHTVTAKVQDGNGLPLVGHTVSFTVLSGPNADLTATRVTDVNGETTFTYTSSIAGSDVIKASFVDSQGLTRDSNRVTKRWEQPNDQINPEVTLFQIPATSSSLRVPITALGATDNIGIAGIMVTGSKRPPLASAKGWFRPTPNTFTPSGYNYTFVETAPTPKRYTLYAWAKDAAGNVSLGKTASVIIHQTDIDKPVVTSFAVAPTATPNTVRITAITASDNVAVTGYRVTTIRKAPLAGAAGWKPSSSPPKKVTFPAGTKRLYAWARDAAGNVSLAKALSLLD